MAGLSDPWLPERLRGYASVARAEQSVLAAFTRLIGTWLGRLHRSVFRPGGAVDPTGLYATLPWFEAKVDDLVQVEIREVIDAAHLAVADDWTPDANAHVKTFLAGARNRLVSVPDHTYDRMRAFTTQAMHEGWAPDELATKIQTVIDADNLADWRGRAMVIARTEAVGAHNAGTFAGFLSYADQLGGDWEKMWLATHDHRTRTTHAAHTGADGQRVPLREPFTVGGFPLMYPGDPAGPPQEVVQCRCTPLLLRPGEHVDLSNRHFRRAS